MAFYLAMRFFLTGEFDENFDFEIFLDNKKWFDIKLLTDATRSSHDDDDVYSKAHSKPMANDTYAKGVKEVLGELGIASNHWLHLGRTIGPKILEVLEVEREDIKNLGNWSPSTQEASYSTKLPMRAVRAASGFVVADGMHYNPRTVVKGPEFERLKKLTPLAWAQKAVVFFDDRFKKNIGDNHFTAYQFVKFMAQLNTIFLQDAAAMLVKYPERSACAMFQMPVFKSDDWPVSIFCVCFIYILFYVLTLSFLLLQRYLALMRTSLETLEAVNPLDCNLEAVLPGVHTRLSTLQAELSNGFKLVKQWKEDDSSSREMAVQMVEANRQMAGQMVQMAAQLLRTGGRDVQASQAPLLLNSQNSQQPADDDDEEECLEKAKRHLMKPSYQSLHVIYYEWYGLESSKDQPIVGGFERCEELYKKTWRKHHNPREKKQYSRLQAIIRGLQKKAASEERRMEQVVDILDPIYQGECKKSLSKMVTYMTERGLIPVGQKRATKT
jgi:hypothetical protein